MYCTHCGKEIDDRAVICVHCGVPTRNMMPAAPATAPQQKKVNAFGIAGFVIGLLSLWLGMFFCIASIIGLVFSIIGMANIKKCNSVNGLAIAGLVLSILSLLFWAFFWIVMIGASAM